MTNWVLARQWGHTKPKHSKGFTGNTKEINGKVFQLQTEQKYRGQFREILD